LFSRIGRKRTLIMKIVEAEKASKCGIGPGARTEVVKGGGRGRGSREAGRYYTIK
jgi:hypothetical protein